MRGAEIGVESRVELEVVSESFNRGASLNRQVWRAADIGIRR